MRLFVVMNLSEGAETHLGGLIATIMRDNRPLVERYGLQPARNRGVHILVKALGTVNDHLALDLHRPRRVWSGGPIRLHAACSDLYPSLARPEAVVARLGGDVDHLQDVTGAVEDVCRQLGFPEAVRRHARPRPPHLILARLPRGLPTTAAATLVRRIDSEMPGPSFTVSRLLVLRVQLMWYDDDYIPLVGLPLPQLH